MTDHELMGLALEEARKALCDAISRSLRENYPDLL